jgi:hypothetical protein
MIATSINATTLALIDAGIAMTDYLCAMTVGLSQGIGLLGRSKTVPLPPYMGVTLFFLILDKNSMLITNSLL